ncbi:hypothetical protein HK102_006722, partial [Quaeritorhiza haematococci]
MLGFKTPPELQLILDPPSDNPDVYEGLAGYDPNLGPQAVLTGKVVLPLTRTLNDVEALILTFTGRVQIDVGALTVAAATSHKKDNSNNITTTVSTINGSPVTITKAQHRQSMKPQPPQSSILVKE